VYEHEISNIHALKQNKLLIFVKKYFGMLKAVIDLTVCILAKYGKNSN